MPEDVQQARALTRIRRLRFALVVIAALFIPLVYGLAALSLPPATLFGIGIGWIGIGVILELLIGFSRCPACRKPFHIQGMKGKLFTHHCLNCGLPLKQEEP